MKPTRWGFTGSQNGADEEVILTTLKELPLLEDDWVVTGGCIGVDSQMFYLVKEHYPEVHQLVVFPANISKVDHTIFRHEPDAIFMPQGTDYRDRNERLVSESDKMIAFWTGKTRSGTFMTINIAYKQVKMYKIVMLK